MERKFEPKLTWNSSRDDVIEEFYKPALSNCVLYQRLAGYFSSTTFANVANEILNFIESNGRIQLITSPKLSESDKELFEKSVLEKEKILSTIFLSDLKDDPKNIKIEFAKLMAYMLTNEINGSPQLEIKIAIPSTGPGIYHQKIGIFKYKNNEKITFSGSINETGTGWRENIENFTVFRSWGDPLISLVNIYAISFANSILIFFGSSFKSLKKIVESIFSFSSTLFSNNSLSDSDNLGLVIN